MKFFPTLEGLSKGTSFLFTRWPLLLMFGILTGGCANTAFPEGGPRDEIPPRVVRSIPGEGARNFKGDEVRVEFNELIQLREVFQKFMVSPPVNTMPEIVTRNREILIRFQEELQSNTTYTLDFADAVSDINEGNILHAFRFSFSTGEVVDSLQISGFLFDAHTLAPIGNALVMAHANHADSAFKSLVPTRVTKTTPGGRFSIQNLAPGEYRIFALEDANRNFKYDQPGERIAWHSTLVSPRVGYRERIDSITTDSVVVVRETAYLPDSLNLFLFHEDNVVQYLAGSERPERYRVNLVFSRPLHERLDVELIGDGRRDWFLYESNTRRDSITLWLTDTTLVQSDSLLARLQYHVQDSAKGLVLVSDTIDAYFFETVPVDAAPQRRRDRGGDATPQPRLEVPGLANSLGIIAPLSTTFAVPMQYVNQEAIRMFQVQDTILLPLEFTLVRDSLQIRRFTFEFARAPGSRYRLEIDSAAFTAINGLTNEAINHEFSIRSEENYGIFYIEVANPRPSWLIQLLDRQGGIVRQAMVPANGKIAFRFLNPGDFFIRVVDDVNLNGRWDTGNFVEGTQPEGIIFFPELVNIRANWSRVIPWNPHLFDIHQFVKTHRQPTGQRRQ